MDIVWIIGCGAKALGWPRPPAAVLSLDEKYLMSKIRWRGLSVRAKFAREVARKTPGKQPRPPAATSPVMNDG